ncbi:50S ribosomal protein L22 [Candidatus Gracilibacteria bacterium]|nr:50S ribosomal protein L22 [Candidatus Gracilibacteria bacterium]
MKAFLKQVRISPKKVNVVAALIRGKKVSDALTQLKFTPKRSAPVVAKLIASAAANAENNFKQDKEKLIISKIIVNEGMTLKRGRPISRGRWHPIKKRTAKILVELSPVVENEKSVESKKEKAKSKKSVEKNEPKEGKVETIKKVEPKVPPVVKIESQKADTEKSEAEKDS